MAAVRRGDTVMVRSGRDRGKTGKVLQVWPKAQRALVEHLNMAKHFDRRTQENPAGGVIARETPMPLAKLGVHCPRCRRAARVGWQLTKEGGKQRVCRRCQQTL